MASAITEIGVPIKILHECEGHKIKVESIAGDLIKGKLVRAEDNMNCTMRKVTLTKKNGEKTKIDFLFIAGSKVKMVILPNALQGSLTLKEMKIEDRRGVRRTGTGRGKADILWAQAQARSSDRYTRRENRAPRSHHREPETGSRHRHSSPRSHSHSHSYSHSHRSSNVTSSSPDSRHKSRDRHHRH